MEITAVPSGDGWYYGSININNIEIWRTSRQYELSADAMREAEKEFVANIRYLFR